MTYEELRDKYFKHVQRNYIDFETFFKNEVPNKEVRDYMRVEAAYLSIMDVFGYLDRIEDDDMFDELIASTHEKADKLTHELGDADRTLVKLIGKEIIDEHLSSISV